MGLSKSKHFDSFAWTFTAIMLAITLVFMNGASFGLTVAAHSMGYENRLFDNTRVHTIDIVMDDWDAFIDNATSEEYYTVAMVIDGEAYKNIAIRGKGNTSLSTVSSLGSERYSFKVEFDHYDNSITYHGLDKLSLNNLIQDSTMMKDYLTYTMMAEFGAAAPLCSFAYLTVNGEDWGLYLAVEGVEDSFLERNYGTNAGELYKPDSMSFGGGRGNGKDFDMGAFDFSGMFGSSEDSAVGSADGNADSSSTSGSTSGGKSGGASGGAFDPSTMFGEDFDPSTMFGGEMPDMSQIPSRESGGDAEGENGETDKSSRPSGGFDMGGMFGGGFGMGSSDVKLQYIDDNVSSYSNIWNNAKTDITTADQNRLIASLKQLSSYQSIPNVVDVDAVIRYFVVHNYVCNGDSYTGSMIHNYYLYEENGQLAMIPWDYNLAFGTFQGGNAQSTVNTPIDTPTSGTGSDRPMWYWIASDETYLAQYHQYFEEFLNTVDIAGIIENAYTLIKDYVAKDPTAFYSYEEFETGVNAMRRFCELRTESITAQLANGTTAEQVDYADAADLNTSDMGSMGGGMGGGKMPGGDFGGSRGDRGNREETPDASENTESAVTESAETEAMPMAFTGNTMGMSQSTASSGGIISLASGNGGGMLGGQMPEGFDPNNMPEGFDPSTIPSDGSFPSGSMPEGFDPSTMPSGGSFPSGQMPEGFDPSTIPSDGSFPSSGMFPGGSVQGGAAGDAQTTNPNSGAQSGSSRVPGNMPSGMSSGMSGSMSGSAGTPVNLSELIPVIISAVVLAIGLVIVKKYPA